MKYFIVFSFLFVSKLSVSQNTFPSSGNVGIGTITPSGSLHVTGMNANAWVYYSGNVNGAGNPANIQGLQFGWNKSNGAGESLIVYNTSLGALPRLWELPK